MFNFTKRKLFFSALAAFLVIGAVLSPELLWKFLIGFFSLEIAWLCFRYISTGSFFPFNFFLIGALEYDSDLGFNYRKNFSTEEIWKGNNWRRKNLEKYCNGAGVNVKINSERYRGKVLLPQKEENVCRIIVLGDSIL